MQEPSVPASALDRHPAPNVCERRLAKATDRGKRSSRARKPSVASGSGPDSARLVDRSVDDISPDDLRSWHGVRESKLLRVGGFD